MKLKDEPVTFRESKLRQHILTALKLPVRKLPEDLLVEFQVKDFLYDLFTVLENPLKSIQKIFQLLETKIRFYSKLNCDFTGSWLQNLLELLNVLYTTFSNRHLASWILIYGWYRQISKNELIINIFFSLKYILL